MSELLQVQELMDRNEQSLEQYLTVVHEFDDPFYLYLNKNDIDNRSPIITFVIYFMGKKKLITWGTYDTVRSDIVFDNLCHYKTSQLYSYLMVWKPRYDIVLSGVKDRFHSRVREFSGITDPLINDRSDYLQAKAYLLMLTDPESIDDVSSYITPEYDIIISRFYQVSLQFWLDPDPIISEHVILDLTDRINHYEKLLNRLDVQRTISIYSNLYQDFYDKLKYIHFTKDQGELCPTIEQCSQTINNPYCEMLNPEDSISRLQRQPTEDELSAYL